MFLSELYEVAKNGDTGDLWEIFNFGNIGTVEITDDKKDYSNEDKSRSLVCHVAEVIPPGFDKWRVQCTMNERQRLGTTNYILLVQTYSSSISPH